MKYSVLVVVLFFIVVEKIHGQDEEVEPCWMACNQTEIQEEPLTVYVGCYINRIASLDIDTQTIKVDVYLWLRWKTCTMIPGGYVPYPHETKLFTNSIDLWGYTSLPSEPDCTIFPGYVYTVERIEATFYQYMDFVSYPLDSHNILMTIEDNEYDITQLRYELDPISNINFDDYMRNALPGWIVNGPVNISSERVYHSDWGIILNSSESIY